MSLSSQTPAPHNFRVQGTILNTAEVLHHTDFYVFCRIFLI